MGFFPEFGIVNSLCYSLLCRRAEVRKYVKRTLGPHTVVHVYKSGAWKVEVERSGVQGHPRLRNKFEASQSHVSPCLKDLKSKSKPKLGGRRGGKRKEEDRRGWYLSLAVLPKFPAPRELCPCSPSPKQTLPFNQAAVYLWFFL